jgi:hypothetical protein
MKLLGHQFQSSLLKSYGIGRRASNVFLLWWIFGIIVVVASAVAFLHDFFRSRYAVFSFCGLFW